MSLSWLVTNLITALLLPPLNGLLLMTLGALLQRRYRWWSMGCNVLGLLLLVALAMPAVGDALLRTLEVDPVQPEQLKQAQAIVVLGFGRYRQAPEYGSDTVSEEGLVRLRYAAKLQRQTGLPILVSGGRPDAVGLSEAETMRRVLTQDLGVPVTWVEGASRNTLENARNSATILKRNGVHTVAVVTHSWHMPRAIASFADTGLTVIPAPTRFYRETPTPLDWLPSRYEESRWAIHEWIGLLWYRVRA